MAERNRLALESTFNTSYLSYSSSACSETNWSRSPSRPSNHWTGCIFKVVDLCFVYLPRDRGLGLGLLSLGLTRQRDGGVCLLKERKVFVPTKRHNETI